jgi:hypothetical protein
MVHLIECLWTLVHLCSFNRYMFSHNRASPLSATAQRSPAACRTEPHVDLKKAWVPDTIESKSIASFPWELLPNSAFAQSDMVTR